MVAHTLCPETSQRRPNNADDSEKHFVFRRVSNDRCFLAFLILYGFIIILCLAAAAFRDDKPRVSAPQPMAARIGDATLHICTEHVGLYRIERGGGSATLTLDELRHIIVSVREELLATDYAFMLRGRPSILKLPNGHGVVVYSLQFHNNVELLLSVQHQPLCDQSEPVAHSDTPALRISLTALVNAYRFLAGANFVLRNSADSSTESL